MSSLREDTPFTRAFAEPDRIRIWEMLKKDVAGNVCAIVLDDADGAPLMQAYMDREAFLLTLETGLMHYHSRSRSRLWLKGETSGHYQHVVSAQVDCDADALVFRVIQEGAACHTGHHSCFFRDLSELTRA
jgi:phosphoribosyl-AMP cyclohydrolase